MMPSNCSVGSGQSSELVDKKSYAKINPIGKLHIIYSLDSGNSKTDIARNYGVHPNTITYIYRQKELILNKYTKKYNQLKEIRMMNLDQTLLDWLKVQISNDITVTENDLLDKVQDMMQHLSEEFTDTEDWLLDFQRRHNIIKYVPESWQTRATIDEWKTFMSKIESDKLYVCGTCAIYHSLFIDSYVAGEQPDDYLSIFFITHPSGSYKRKLVIAGKEQLKTEIKSLPANYYANNCYINQHTLASYLQEWDNELSSEGKNVYLALNMPNSNLFTMQFKNIRIVTTNMEFLSKSLEKIIECFKCHYKKLQIMKTMENIHYFDLEVLDYINMISLAWFNVPDLYIRQIFIPPIPESLHQRDFDDCDGNHSLVQWCETYNISLDLQSHEHCLDQYISCDNDLKSYDFDDRTIVYEVNKNAEPSSGMEAYQAMKRLLSYMQGERASEDILKTAKHLENHLEYDTLLEIHEVIARNSSE